MARRSSEIRLSEKHGLNPSMLVCFVCGNDTGEIALMGRLKGDIEAPRRSVLPGSEPCAECREHMKAGIILISVKDGSDQKNPYRTGGWVVIKEEAAKNIFKDNAESLMKVRMAFVEDSAWDKLGLPR